MQLTTLIAPGLGATGAGRGDLDITLPQGLAPTALEGLEITGLTADSRKVRPGFLFVAIPGTVADGAKFAGKAAAAGAVAILAAEGAELSKSSTGDPLRIPVLRTLEPRAALALLAARFYDKQPDTIVAVTGTSGKTSVAEFTRQIFAVLGREAASLGTIGLVKPDGGVYGSLTTPDPVDLAATLCELEGEGVTHLALEASSHGLDQHRLDGVRLIAGAFTNLGRDHLDYHADVEEYLTAKLRLFDRLLDPAHGCAVVNADDARAGDVIAIAKRRGLRLITVGTKGETLRLVKVERDGFAQRIAVASTIDPIGDQTGSRDDGANDTTGERLHEIRLRLIGDYQASNALVAAGLAIAAGEDAGKAIAAIAALKGVKGRLEIVAEAKGGLAVVDYAHKPDALLAVLTALRPFATGRLICVFGCGGDRDKGKRAIMGKIAMEHADVIIVTDDNPRTENPAAVRAQILSDIEGGVGKGAIEIGNRGKAIAAGVAMLGAGDVLVVAGKGHEEGQIVGDRVLPFSDHDAIADALSGSAKP